MRVRKTRMTDAKSPERGKRFGYAVIVSTVALLISATSFYFTWFYEDHSLKLGVVSSYPDDVVLPSTFVTDLILLNQGNKTETLLSLELSLDDPADPAGGTRTYEPELRKGPFVLKAGDALPIKIEWEITEDTFNDVALWSGPDIERSATASMSLRVTAVGPTGAQIKKTLGVGRFEYYEPSGTVKYLDVAPSETSLHELMD